MSFGNAARAVVARIFQLVNSAGQIVAQLDSSSLTQPFIKFFHLDTAHFDKESAIAWSTGVNATQSLQIYGPRHAGGTSGQPLVQLSSSTTDVVTARVGVGGVADTSVSSTIMTRTDGTHLDTTTSVFDSTGISTVLALSTTAGTARSLTSVVNGAHTATVDVLANAAQSYVSLLGDSVQFFPGVSGTLLNSRTAYMCLGEFEYTLPANTAMPGNLSFLLNGATSPFTIRRGDIVVVNAQIMVTYAGATGTEQWTAYPQYIGDLGNATDPVTGTDVLPAPLGVAASWGNHFSWVHTVGTEMSTTGSALTVAIIGGHFIGTNHETMLANRCRVQVVAYATR